MPCLQSCKSIVLKLLLIVCSSSWHSPPEISADDFRKNMVCFVAIPSACAVEPVQATSMHSSFPINSYNPINFSEASRLLACLCCPMNNTTDYYYYDWKHCKTQVELCTKNVLGSSSIQWLRNPPVSQNHRTPLPLPRHGCYSSINTSSLIVHQKPLLHERNHHFKVFHLSGPGQICNVL